MRGTCVVVDAKFGHAKAKRKAEKQKLEKEIRAWGFRPGRSWFKQKGPSFREKGFVLNMSFPVRSSCIAPCRYRRNSSQFAVCRLLEVECRSAVLDLSLATICAQKSQGSWFSLALRLFFFVELRVYRRESVVRYGRLRCLKPDPKGNVSTTLFVLPPVQGQAQP